MCKGDREIEELRKLIGTTRRRLSKLRLQVSRAEELGDSLEFELAEINRMANQMTTNGSGPVDRIFTSAKEEKTLRDLAEHGAGSLEINPRAGGEAECRIDGGPRFILPQALADLLHILALGDVDEQDQMVEWKTKDEVAILLGERLGRHISPGAVNTLVWRLRKALSKDGRANPFLIQTSRSKGLRFALGCKCAVTGGNEW